MKLEKIVFSASGEGYITPYTACTEILGGTGALASLARINSSHVNPKMEYAREWVTCNQEMTRVSENGKSGRIVWDIPGPGLYELREFAHSRTKSIKRMFVKVTPDGVDMLDGFALRAEIARLDSVVSWG